MYTDELNTDGIFFAYLRKSREDRDAEQHGAGDTLARHEYIINGLAKRYHIKIARWYREVVSGETISGRPEMQKLLSDVEAVHPDGVLVVEIERLSRGSSQDQGRVIDTFKYSGTKIVTPQKIYDLMQENDEEWADFGLMRSRMEYRTIKRRLETGRMTSAMQGKFVGSIPPYGWDKVRLKGEKGYTLVPNPQQIETVKLIYTLMSEGNEYTNGPVGLYKVAEILNGLNIVPPKGEKWHNSTIVRIVTNPTHIGMSRIGYSRQVVSVVDGIKKTARPANLDCVLVPARWEGVVSKETFDRVLEGLKTRISPRNNRRRNPFAGILYCAKCGRTMQLTIPSKKYQVHTLSCPTAGCPTVSARLDLVEGKVLEALERILERYKLEIDGGYSPDNREVVLIKKQLKTANSKLEKYQKQLSKIHACFEQDIYDMDTFLERSNAVKAEIDSCNNSIKEAQDRLEEISLHNECRETIVPRFEGILDAYRRTEDREKKNLLLKELVSRIDYSKDDRGNWKRPTDFSLDIHLRIQP